MLRNVVDTLINGDTAWERKFGTEFQGPIIPFGAELLYKPSSPEDISVLTNLGTSFFMVFLLVTSFMRGVDGPVMFC